MNMYQEVIECVLFVLFSNAGNVLLLSNLQVSYLSVNKDSDLTDVVHNEDFKYASYLTEYVQNQFTLYGT